MRVAAGDRRRGDSLLALPNVIGTAHNSYASPTAAAEAAKNALDNIAAYLAGRPVKGRARIDEYVCVGA